jgi:transposase
MEVEMIRITFTEEQVAQLRYERFHHPHPRVQAKMEALLLKSEGLAHKEICRIVGITGNTLRAYLREFLAGGVDALKESRRSNSRGALDGHRTTLEAYFREHPPATVKEAVAKIEEFTGIRRSETQVRKFLKSLGMRRLKVGYVPAKADPEEQERFKKEDLEPRLDEARAGRRTVLFVDAAHFVLAPFVGYVWCIVRQFVRAAAGRQRLNVLAALDAITHQLVTVANDTYINAQSVCQLLHKLAALRLGIPITLVLDNARYQKCRLVQQLADELHIELLYLPSYSPNLNLIERLWKFVKKKTLNAKYYENFAAFKAAITTCIADAPTKHKAELDSLLTLRFQTFSKAQSCAA